MQDVGHMVVNAGIVLFFIVICVGSFRRFFSNAFGRTVSRRAVLIDKYATQYQVVGRHAPVQTKTRYVLTFICGPKTVKLEVSLWVYSTVEKGDKGMLTYRGTRFVNFEDS